MPAAEDRQRLLALRTRARRSRALGAGRCGRSAPRTRSPSDLLSRASVGSRCYWQGGHIRWRAQTSRRSRCRECSRRRIQSGSGDTLAETGVRLQVPRAESTPATSRRRSSPRPRSRRLGDGLLVIAVGTRAQLANQNRARHAPDSRSLEASFGGCHRGSGGRIAQRGRQAGWPARAVTRRARRQGERAKVRPVRPHDADEVLFPHGWPPSGLM